MIRTEGFVQLCIVLCSVWIVQMDKDWEPQKYGCDFRIYYEAASGRPTDDWLYKDFVAYLFKPFTLISFPRALYLWNGLLVVSYMVLAHYLMKVKYGAVLALVFLRPFTWSLVAGNITPMLCLAAIFPTTSFLAILVKPYFVVFSIVHAIKEGIKLRREKRINKKGHDPNLPTGILFT